MLKKSTGLRNKLLGLKPQIVKTPLLDDGNTTDWAVSGIEILAQSSGGWDNGAFFELRNTSSANGDFYQELSVVKGRSYKFITHIKSKDAAVGGVPISVTIEDLVTHNTIYDFGSYSGTAWKVIEELLVFDTNRIAIHYTLNAGEADKYAAVDDTFLFDISNGFKDIFMDSVIEIYSGSQPNSADDPVQGTLLVTISNNGSSDVGLTFADPQDGKITKNPSEVWSGVAVATGTAGWFRLKTKVDDNGSSTVYERVDGAIGTAGAELNMANTTIQANAIQTISVFEITINP